MNGILYLVATPIGNLDDITIRALEILRKVDLIAAEDTRHTLGLLNHFDINKPLISYYKQIEKSKSEILINKLKEGLSIALVSDAGTPGISDPGEEIVKSAIENGIKIVPIPGACAMVNALIASGMSTKEFSFIGFLSANRKEKKDKLEELVYETRTLIFYEAPHKLETTLKMMYEVFGNRKIVLARELTKIHEEFIRDNLENIINNIENYRGEYVLILEGSNESKKEVAVKELTDLSLEEHYKVYENQGFDKKEIIKKIAKDRNVSKNEIYQYFL